MGKKKTLCLLLGVLAVICVAAVVVSRVEQRKEDIRSGEVTVLSIETESVTALSWEYGGNSFAFHKEDKWLYDGDEQFPVDQSAIETLLETFSSFTAAFTIEAPEELGDYGLDDPTATIHVETAGESYDILLGDYSQMDSQRYVSIGDGSVYLATEDPLNEYNVLLSGLIRHDSIPAFSTDAVTSLRFDGENGYTAAYEAESGKSYDEDDVFFTTDGSKALALDTTRVRSYLNTMTYLNLTDYVTYSADSSALDAYGLDDPELTVTVSYTVTDADGTAHEETFTLSVSRDPAQRDTEADEEETDSIVAYVRVGDSPIVYQITGEEYADLMACTKNDLRHQSLLWAAFTDITQIDVTLEGETYTLTSQVEDDDHIWYYGEEKLSIGDLQSALTGLTAEAFTTRQPDGKEELSFTVYLDNEAIPSVDFSIYRHDGSTCIVTVDGTSTAYITRSSAMSLVEAVNAIVLN